MSTTTPSTTEPTPGTTPGSAAAKNRWYLSAAPIGRALVHLCVPMAAAMVVSAVYNVINAGFIGAQHDTSLLAAITFGTPLLGLIMAVGGVFGVGGSALMSRMLGASEHDPAKAQDIKRVASFALWGAVVTGAVLAVVGLVFLQPLVAVLGADAAAVPATSAYVAVMLAFVPVLAASFALEQIVRSEGAARQAMVGLILSTIGNLVFDVLFILVLHWGVAGAALAIGLGNLVAIGYWIVWLQRHSENVSFAPKWFTLRRDILAGVFGIGSSELLQSAFLIVTTLVLNNLAAAYGDDPLAAMGVAVRIAQVPEFLVMGVTIGVLPLLAYAFGKGDAARLRAALRGAAFTVGTIVLVFSGTVFVFREQVFTIFSGDHSVLAIGLTILTAQLVAAIVNGFTGLLTSLFQATGMVLPAMMLSMAQGVLFIPIVIVGNLWFGLAGIIWALTVTEVLVFAAALVLWVASRGRIARGLAEGSPERADATLEAAAV
ncbi:putative MATE family efflux protein [Curtobacterium flaccumfaciens]|uniref:Putative MATE family efflux protein n=1 Tax=Curtobacterium flaccumfaciens TaxID=2035 RepID=A0A4R6DDT9_9MICO|nr:MATE family efflux transporter [Curtobacterium flaccumfaciens]TDN42590.1 putative MATE family efflux protein [Curtobacterium flaccumfaciens]